MKRSAFVSLVLAIVLLMGVSSQPVSRADRPTGRVAVIPYDGSAAPAMAASVTRDSHASLQWSIFKALVPEAWRVTSGDASVIIAVLDTGIDRTHEDLVGRVVAEVNFTTSPTAGDVYGHGTHVAGIIAAAANNGVGIAGLAYDCRLLNVKVADDGGWVTAEALAKGIIWAVDHGARVINMSLYLLEPSVEVERSVSYAWEKGAVLVASSGNYLGSRLTYPAYYEKCLGVAATDMHDEVTAWSGKGSWVEVAAPGVSIYSLLPGNKYQALSGTSMAAAHVSGLAGLLFSVANDRNGDGRANDEVRAAIEASCDRLYSSGVKGRINALRAVERLVGAE
jgi:thermitase